LSGAGGIDGVVHIIVDEVGSLLYFATPTAQL
jgi:hypothetical protein